MCSSIAREMLDQIIPSKHQKENKDYKTAISDWKKMLSNQTVLFFGDRVSGVTARAALYVIYPNSSVSDPSQGNRVHMKCP